MRAVCGGGAEHVEDQVKKQSKNPKIMKAASKLFWCMALLTICSVTVCVLDVIDLHPGIDIGNYYVFWKGVRDMDLQSGYGVNPLTNGKTETRREEDFGPIQIGYIKVQ